MKRIFLTSVVCLLAVLLSQTTQAQIYGNLTTTPAGYLDVTIGSSVNANGLLVQRPEGSYFNRPAGIEMSGGLTGNAKIELRNNSSGTPYIDFSSSTSPDYDARFILRNTNLIGLDGASLHIGYSSTQGSTKFAVNGTSFFGNSVGIGTSAPAASLHVEDGGLLVNGNTGGTPVSGSGVRMMWIPAKRALRVGQAFGSEWNDANVGSDSYAWGNNLTVSGSGFAMGFNSTVTSPSGGFSFGYSNEVSGFAIGTFGFDNRVSGTHGITIGSSVDATAFNSYTIGSGQFPGSSSHLINNIANSIMIGVATTVPSIFVEAGSGGGGGGRVGIGNITAPTHILHVNGVARSTQSTWATSSDFRVKENVQEVENATDKLMQLRPVTFNWTNEYREAYPAVKENEIGFIAQEVEAVAPEMVEMVSETIGENTIEDFKLLNLSPLFPLLVKATQEQQEELATLKAQNEAYETRLAALEAQVAALLANNGGTKVGSKGGSDLGTTGFLLEQNQPNPFNRSTSIGYELTGAFSSAQITVTDMTGIDLLSQDISEGGKGQITIQANALTAGNYIYSLVVDGQVVDSKRMIVQ